MKLGIQTAVALALFALSAAAQSFNIDTNRTTGTGNGVPANSFGGAAGQTGAWTGILPTVATPVTLSHLNGAASTVTVTRSGSTNGSSDSVAGASTDYSKLMWDYAAPTGLGQFAAYTFGGLTAGMYRAYVYAALPGASGLYNSGFGSFYHVNYLSVTVNSTTVGTATTWGAVTANVFQKGVTHAEIPFAITSGQIVKIQTLVDPANALGAAALNGIQLIHYSGNVLYVNDDAPGNQTGFSWTDAFHDLQDALAAARASGGQITEIWVADGDYHPTSTTDRSKSFDLVEGVKMYGGFVGTETALSQRPAGTGATFLNGALGGFNYSYHVVTAHGRTSATVMDGFIVLYGRADGADFFGGGLCAVNGSPTVRNTVFGGNYAIMGGAVSIRCNNGYIGNPSFENCRFVGNTANGEGGAIYWEGEDGFFVDAYLSVVNCLFAENSTEANDGGAITFGGDGYVINSRFTGNEAQQGNAGAIQTKATDTQVWVQNSTLVGNTAAGAGGAIRVQTDTAMTITNSILWANVSPSANIGFRQIVSQVAGQPVVSSSCVQTNSTPYAGIGNVTVNPQFIDIDGADNVLGTQDDDFRLTYYSPMIDAGSTVATPYDMTDLDRDGIYAEPIPFDAAGLSRLNDGNGDLAALVDIGAYEAGVNTQVPNFPGSNEDFWLFGGINGLLPFVGADVWGTPTSLPMYLRIDSPLGTFDGHIFVLAAQLTGWNDPLPTFAAYPELHVNDQGGLVVTQGLITSGPVDLVYTIPAGLSGFKLIMQALALDPMAANGIFAASNAQVFTIN